MLTRILVVCALGSMIVAGCAKKDSGAAAGGMTMADSMKAAYKAVSDAWDAGKVDEFDKYISANSVDHDAMPGQKQGLEGMKEFAKMMHGWFPDMKSTIEDMRVDGDVLTARFKMSGTNSGSMMGMPATNKKIDGVNGIDQVRWQNGKFTEHWGVFDAMGMMQKLGLAPMPGGGAPPAGGDMKKDMGGDKKM